MAHCTRCGIVNIAEKVELRTTFEGKVMVHLCVFMCPACSAQFVRTFSAYIGGAAKRVDWEDYKEDEKQ